jgi:hypothetical protein
MPTSVAIAAPGVVDPPPHRNREPLATPNVVVLPPETIESTATALGDGVMLGVGEAVGDGVGSSISQINGPITVTVDCSSFTPPPAYKVHRSSL